MGFNGSLTLLGKSQKSRIQKSKVLYIKAFACKKWLLYFRRVLLELRSLEFNDS